MTADTNTGTDQAASQTGEQAGDGQAQANGGAVATGKQRPQLPEGIVSPIAALNVLKQRNLAPADYKPQQMYGFVKNPGKTDPFPVKHYDATGQVFDTPQINEHGITTTRPGVKVEEVVAWWGRKGDRDKAKAEAKAAKAAADAAKAAAAPATPAEGETAAASDGGEDVSADEGEFEEAQ